MGMFNTITKSDYDPGFSIDLIWTTWGFLQTTQSCLKKFLTTKSTRKSSCVNARGIPTAVYQVLHMLSYPGGYLPWLGEGYLPWPRGTYLGVPPILTWLGEGYLPWLGVGNPPPILTWLEGTVPTLAGGYLPWYRYPSPTKVGTPPAKVGTPLPSGPVQGTPPPGVNRLKTLPSAILRMRSVKITSSEARSHNHFSRV